MMETQKLRRADFVTSIIMMLAAVAILIMTFQMPMRDTYGGVRNVWYVSPALLPLIVGFGILILSVVLLFNSIRTGGAADCIAGLKTMTVRIDDANQRFIGILLALGTFVYLYIPRVDFFLSIMLFLAYFVPAYYYDELSDLRKLSVLYGAIATVFLVLFATGIADRINDGFAFATDVIALVGTIVLLVSARRLAGSDRERVRKFRLSLIVTIVTPLFLTPVFRFLLFVRLPHEGGIVQLLQLIWYSLR